MKCLHPLWSETIGCHIHEVCEHDTTRKEVRTMSERQPKVGQHVVYHDPKGIAHDALVTAVWSQLPIGCVNLVIVNDNEAQTDQYGRQIMRTTSQTHRDYIKVHGNYWRFTDEEPNPYVAPVEQ